MSRNVDEIVDLEDGLGRPQGSHDFEKAVSEVGQVTDAGIHYPFLANFRTDE